MFYLASSKIHKIHKNLISVDFTGILKIIFSQEKAMIYEEKNLPASRAHSHRAPRAPRVRYSIVALRAPEFLYVALCAPFFLDLALRARSCALRIHLNLFFII